MSRCISLSSRRYVFNDSCGVLQCCLQMSNARSGSPAQALSQRSASGAIDLDDLEPDSPLVTMKTLHKLRFNGAPLDPVRREAPVHWRRQH